jgi:AmiR/NasT family two-component response regulator
MTNHIDKVRDLSVVVMHPRGKTADDLLRQIHRIGCAFEAVWPIPDNLPHGVDVLFINLDESTPSLVKALLSKAKAAPPAIVAIVEYENPSVLAGLFEIGAHSVITKPVRAADIMSAILMARRYWSESQKSEKDILKLKARLENVQKVHDAKAILRRHRGLSDKEAYAIIRKQAMAKRTTTLEIAQSIINADGLLSDLGND